MLNGRLVGSLSHDDTHSFYEIETIQLGRLKFSSKRPVGVLLESRFDDWFNELLDSLQFDSERYDVSVTDISTVEDNIVISGRFAMEAVK